MVHPFLDHSGIMAIAHRGGNETAPENTMAAFAHAVSLGYRCIETDVHASRDGVLMAFHDADLGRLAGVSARIGDLDFAQISRLRIDGEHAIPRLEDLLDAWPDIRINIDPKSDAAVAPLERLLKGKRVLERICIGSFSHRRLRHLRESLGPGLCSSASPLEVAALRFARPRRPAYACLQIPLRHFAVPVLSPALLTRARRSGLPVHVWTINDPVQMKHLAAMGVDGIMTDRLSLLLDVLEEHTTGTGAGTASSRRPPA